MKSPRRNPLTGLLSMAVALSALFGSTARAGDFDKWAPNEVPVVILLGQSNTDGRAVYSFNNNDAGEIARIHPGGGAPCTTTESPTCAALDLRKIYLDGGKIAGGLGNPSLEFTSTAERAAIGDILNKRPHWNDSWSNIVRVYIPRFNTSHPTDNPSGKLAVMQPRVTDPADGHYALNAMIGNGTWNTKDIFGPEVGLAVKWSANISARPLYIVKFAVGGTSIKSNGNPYGHWGLSGGAPVAGSLVRPAESVIDDAVAAIRAQGKVPRLVGIYWGQGEASRNDTDYATSLKNLMARLRSSTGTPNARFFVQTIYSGDDNADNLRQRQIDACTSDRNCQLISLNDFASSEGASLKYPTDKEAVHYTAHGEMLIGARLFGKVREALSQAAVMR